MARPKESDSAKTHKQIVEAALELLREKRDPSFLSMRRVAARAGLSPSTLQYYFTSKEALLEACLDGYHERLSLRVKAALTAVATTSDTRRKVEATLRSFIAFIREEELLVALRVMTTARRGGLHPSRQAEFLGSFVREAVALLGQHSALEPLEARLLIHGLTLSLPRILLMSPEEQAGLHGKHDIPSQAELDDALVRIVLRILKH
ncbi:MAG: TetR/AcrR family transcriptional regulator [Polyangiaceae bacterium]|nr:TetR/AcrR family transcriptional regulator [Myxococcales bacterium]MCB9587896.1 TetR/AcrR family transcriptional regulator [Polyangiaceae bacterium]